MVLTDIRLAYTVLDYSHASIEHLPSLVRLATSSSSVPWPLFGWKTTLARRSLSSTEMTLQTLSKEETPFINAGPIFIHIT